MHIEKSEIPELLTQKAIDRHLSKLKFWLLEDGSISREIVCSNFASAVGFLNSIAIISEKLDHHPDILLYGWNKLRITSTTHEFGGITSKDISLANAIEELKFGIEA